MMRNSYAQTTVAPYAIRAKKSAPIATPIDWEELKDKDLDPQHYTIKNIFQRLGQREDPWRDINRHAQSADSRKDTIKKLMQD